MVEKAIKVREALIEKFKDLSFVEETHTYTLNGIKLPSVSSLLENFYEKFDSASMAEEYAFKRNFINKDVLDAWQGENKIAVDKGHKVHLFGENYARWKYWGEGERPKVTCKQCLGIVDFYNSLPENIVPVGIETRMYNEELGYSGTADIILMDVLTESLYVADFKTNGALWNDKYPAKPLLHLPKTLKLLQDNFGKYSLQFSFYQILLERAGFKVSGRGLIWLQDDTENKKLFHKLPTIDVTKELLTFLLERK